MMKAIVIGAAALSLAFAAVPAVAQNMQGPGAVNFGAGSSPQTGGIPTTRPNAANPQTTPTQRGTHGLYNYDNNQTGLGGSPADNNNGNGQRR